MKGIRIGVVTGSRVGVNGDGDEPGRILQAAITDSPDVQNVQTCQQGDEYNPPNGTTVVLAAGGEAYKVALVLDDGIAPAMTPGGRRIYATDADGEAEVAECRLHPDGKVELFNEAAALTMLPTGAVTVSNGAASFTMSADGYFTFHAVGSTFDHPVAMQAGLTVTGSPVNVTGTITASVDVTGGGKSLATHTHSDPQGGTTGVPN